MTAQARERDEKVRAVLRAAIGPMAPTAIAAQISESWCCWNGKPSGAHSAAISPILKRIGAVGAKGKWALPTSVDPKARA